MKIKQTAGRDSLGAFAPEFARLNDDVLFGEVWSDDTLSLRDRSLVTVVTLIAEGLTDSSFRYHLETAKNNGITATEIAAIITHAAFYAGWPKAWAAFRIAKEVWGDKTIGNASYEAHKRASIFPVGAPNDAFARYFTGKSYLAPLADSVFNVTFEPRARNNYHIHRADKGGGQILLCVAGKGIYEEEGKPARLLEAGDVVSISEGVKHWHGAADEWFSHIAIEVKGENSRTEWLEAIDDEHYTSVLANLKKQNNG